MSGPWWGFIVVAIIVLAAVWPFVTGAIEGWLVRRDQRRNRR